MEGIKDQYTEDVGLRPCGGLREPASHPRRLEQGRVRPSRARTGASPKLRTTSNESWVFILDREGRVTRKYEGFASADELEQGLAEVI